jgi:hypothetical protein
LILPLLGTVVIPIAILLSLKGGVRARTKLIVTLSCTV